MGIFDDVIQSQPVVFDWARHSGGKIVNVNVDLSEEVVSAQMVGLIKSYRVDFEAYVLRHKVAKATQSTSVSLSLLFPSSPWQHFKMNHSGSWWLGWLVRRRPVRMTQHNDRREVTLNVDRFHEFPEARYAMPDFGSPVVVECASWDTRSRSLKDSSQP